MTLRWRDVRFLDHKLIVSRTLSADVEADSPKRGRFRDVPLPDQAAPAVDRLGRRPNYSGPTSTCSAIASVAAWTRQRHAAATSVPATRRSSPLSASTTFATPMAPRPATELDERFTRALLGTSRDQAEATSSSAQPA